MIPVEESFAAWRNDPEYVEAYDAREDEFALAAAMIEARARAGLTQEQLAQRMHTTQAVLARLKSGRVKPSTRTHSTVFALRFYEVQHRRSIDLRAANSLGGPVVFPS
jgi:ribosome-binding protein aMBF1 (putative translation factor)